MPPAPVRDVAARVRRCRRPARAASARPRRTHAGACSACACSAWFYHIWNPNFSIHPCNPGPCDARRVAPPGARSGFPPHRSTDARRDARRTWDVPLEIQHRKEGVGDTRSACTVGFQNARASPRTHVHQVTLVRYQLAIGTKGAIRERLRGEAATSHPSMSLKTPHRVV